MSPENKSKLISSDFLNEQQNILDQYPFYDFIEQILEKTNKPIETFEDFTKVLKVIRLAVWKNDPNKTIKNYGLRRNFIKEIASVFPSTEIVDRLATDIHSEIEQIPYLSDYINDFWVRDAPYDIRGITSGVYNYCGKRRKSSGCNPVNGERHIDRYRTYLSYAQEKAATAQSVKLNGILEDLSSLGFTTRLPSQAKDVKSPKHFFRLIDSESLK